MTVNGIDIHAARQENEYYTNSCCFVDSEADKRVYWYREDEDVGNYCKNCRGYCKLTGVDGSLDFQAQVPVCLDWRRLEHHSEECCYHETQINCVDYL